jgi:hypothetical protein
MSDGLLRRVESMIWRSTTHSDEPLLITHFNDVALGGFIEEFSGEVSILAIFLSIFHDFF